MVKLNNQVQSLEKGMEKIQQKIENLRDKYVAIEEKAWNEYREMTAKEHGKRYNILEEIEELENELHEIEFAIDYLRPFTD